MLRMLRMLRVLLRMLLLRVLLRMLLLRVLLRVLRMLLRMLLRVLLRMLRMLLRMLRVLLRMLLLRVLRVLSTGGSANSSTCALRTSSRLRLPHGMPPRRTSDHVRTSHRTRTRSLVA